MTSATRRTLLAASALGAALAPVLLAPDVYAAATTRRDLYTRSRFWALRRKTFRLDGAGRHWRVKLTKVGNLPNMPEEEPARVQPDLPQRGERARAGQLRAASPGIQADDAVPGAERPRPAYLRGRDLPQALTDLGSVA